MLRQTSVPRMRSSRSHDYSDELELDWFLESVRPFRRCALFAVYTEAFGNLSWTKLSVGMMCVMVAALGGSIASAFRRRRNLDPTLR